MMKSIITFCLLVSFVNSAHADYPRKFGGYVVPYQKYYVATNDTSPIPGIHNSKSLQEVNNRVNHYVKYVFDPKNHWQSPKETIDKGTGECIDYVLLKRQIIIQLGLAKTEDMEVLLVYDRQHQQEHAVLKVGNKILDSQIDKVYNFNSKLFKNKYKMQVVVKQ